MKQKIRHWYDRILSLMLTMLGFGGTFALMGCPVAYGPAPEDYRVTVVPGHLSFGNSDNVVKSVQIHTEGQWYINKVTPFMLVTPTSGSGYSTISVRMSERNSGNEGRKGIIVIQSVDDPYYTDTVHVYQNNDSYDY